MIRFRIHYCLPAVFALAASLQAQVPSGLNVVSLGAVPDASESMNTTSAFLQAFALNPNGLITVPDGDYLIDNSKGALLVTGFNGELAFSGSARLIFLDNTQGGLWFTGGQGARIHGLRATYQVKPTVRASPNEQIKFMDTVDTSVTDITLFNSPAAGILFYHCVRPKVTTALIQDSLADGLHFANCQDAQASNITTNNTGDDGLAFLNYAQYPDLSGGVAYNIVVNNSRSRGISVVGQSNVQIGNFQVNGTSSSGILCAFDSSYNTRRPANVRFSSGTIVNAGTLPGQKGNGYGIEFDEPLSCSFSDIKVSGSSAKGLSGTASTGSVTVTNVRISDNPGAGFSFRNVANLQIQSSTAESTGDYGFYFGKCGTVVATGLTATNTSKTSNLHRAMWFEDSLSILASGLTVVDSQATPTGYVVGTSEVSAGSQSGMITGVNSQIGASSLILQNGSRSVRVVTAGQ